MRQAPELNSLTEEPASKIQPADLSNPDPSIFKEKSFSELLDVANINREEILERVKIVQAKIDDGQSPDEKELEKFNKIKSKLEAGEAYIDFDEINIKYLTQENIQKLSASASKTKITLTPQPYQASRTSSTMRSGLEYDIEYIDVKKINDSSFVMSYYGSQGNYDMKLGFSKNKCKITFDYTFPHVGNILYPEEMQILMLKQLASKFPDIKEKISNISELDLERHGLVNENTIQILKTYIANRKALAPSAVAPSIPFPKTPNGNNSMNFLRKFLEEFFPKREVSFDKAKILTDQYMDLSFRFKFKFEKAPSTAISAGEHEGVLGGEVAGKRKSEAIEK